MDAAVMPEFSDGVVALGFFAPADARVLLEADGDREHRRWFEFPEDFVPSLQHSESVIRRWEDERVAGTRFAFAVRSATSHDLLGGCELRPLGDGRANLSYWTYPRHRCHGVASRAVKLACEVASSEFDFRIVQVIVDPENMASRRVALRNAFDEVGERDGRILYILDLTRARGR